jgi:hypothetical protein
MKKQTAVEWLIEIYLTTGIDRNVHFHQAKEMEKGQIIKAAARGYLAMPERFNLEEAKDYGQQYYDNICGGNENE